MIGFVGGLQDPLSVHEKGEDCRVGLAFKDVDVVTLCVDSVWLALETVEVGS